MKSLSSVCLPVCLSVRPSLNFLKIASLDFSDILHDDSWPCYLATDEVRMDLMDLNQAQNEVFCHFLEFESYLFPGIWFSLKFHTMIACNNIYHLVGVKSTKKNFWTKFWAKSAKIGPKITSRN